jgi:hypothetical protein
MQTKLYIHTKRSFLVLACYAIALSVFISFFCFYIKKADASAQLQTLRPSSNNLGLVGLWSFDGADVTDKVYDRSGNANNGTFVGGATSSAKVVGKIGQALRFDGVDDYVETPLQVTGDQVTMSLWAKKLGAGPNDPEAIMISQYATYLDYCYAGQTLFTLTTVVGGAKDLSGGSCPPTGTWTHYVGTYDGSMMRLYMNGVEVASTSKTGSLNNNFQSFFIGKYSGGGYEFNGIIDDVRVYNRGLSATDVKKLYNSGLATGNKSPSSTITNGLVGLWTLDGADVTNKVYDRSGNGNDMGFYGGATSTAKTPGRMGQGLRFDGVDDYAVTSGNTFPWPTSAYSLSVWAKKMGSGTSEPRQIMIGDSSANYLDMCASGHPMFSVNTTVTQNIVYGSNDCAGTGVWTHYLGTWNGSRANLYVNGIDVSGDFPTSGTLLPQNDVTIGTYQVGSFTTNGVLDDARVYNRALTAAEVRQLYNAGSAKLQASQNGKVTNGLVGLWSFDGPDVTDKVYDRSGQNHHGGFTGGATSSAKVVGKMGQAFNFDGADDIVDTGSEFIGTGPGTFSAWIYARNDGENGLGSIIDNRGVVFGLGATFSGAVSFSSDSGITNATGANGSIAYNRWYHVTATRDAAGIANIYVNGVLSGSANQSSGTPAAGAQNVDIGNTVFLSRTWDGYLDDVRIYNRVLSLAEIKQLYDMGK